MKSVLLLILLFPLTLRAEPYTISYGVDGKFAEVNIKIIGELYRHLDMTPEFIRLPTPRLLPDLNDGKTDATLFRVAGAQHPFEHVMSLASPHYFVSIHAFSRRALSIQNWADLEPFRLAYIAGFAAAQNQTAGMNRVETKTLEQAMKLLEEDRVDVVIASRDTGLELIRSWPDSTIIMLPTPIQNIPLFHYVHERHENLIEPLNQALNEMRDSGELEKIIINTLGF